MSGICKLNQSDVLNLELLILHCLCGGLAQLGEHNVRNVGVGGSNPLPSTTQYDPFLRFEVHGLALVA
jgi:hypothetical protein